MNRKFISKINRVLIKVLNTKENIEILEEFIEVILNINIDDIELNSYLESKKNNLPSEEDFGIADFRITTLDGEELNVGIQIIDGEHILTKILLYLAQIHLNQLEYDTERTVAKTVTINILDCNFTGKKEYHTKMLLKDKDLQDTWNNFLEVNILELPNLKARSNGAITLKEAWVSYFKGENINLAINKSENIKKLNKLLKEYWDKEIME